MTLRCFLLRRAKCYDNKPTNFTEIPKVLPGYTWDGTQQCRFMYDKNHTLCWMTTVGNLFLLVSVLCCSGRFPFAWAALSEQSVLNGTHEFSELVLARMALLIDKSRSVLPLRSAKEREFGDWLRDKMHACAETICRIAHVLGILLMISY